MDWIHCNSCFQLPIKSKNNKFSLTSCGHIYCENCVKPGDTNHKCLICGNSFTMISLTAEMRPDVQEYFKNVEDILKQFQKVITFQGEHRMRIISYYNTVVMKYKAAKQEIMRLTGIVRKQDKENKDMKQEIKDLKEKLFKLESQRLTPSYSNIGRSNMNSQSQSSIFWQTPNKMNPSPNSVITPVHSGNNTSRSINSLLPALQTKHWVTPKRVTLRKMTPPSSGSSGNSHLLNLSPLTSPHSFNYPGSYRAKGQYPSQPNTPSTPGSSPCTPESARLSPLDGHHRANLPVIGMPRCGSTSTPLNSTLNSLTLAMKRPRDK